MDSNIKNQLTRILTDLNKINGIDGSLIADNNGNVICHNMSQGTDISLFGPMAHVITSSSKRLLSSANQGEIERVLVESEGGKALFLHLGNAHFIVLMEISANVGLVMVSAKRAALEIIELTKDIVMIEPVKEVITEEIPLEKSEIDKVIEADELGHKDIEEMVDKIAETEGIEEAFDKVVGTEKLDEIRESKEFKTLDISEAKEKLAEILEIETEGTKPADIESKDVKISEKSEIKAENADILPETEETGLKSEIEDELSTEKVETQEKEEVEEPESILPVIKPPISFPKLPENVKIPAGDKEKSDLILDIYEAIFLAMSLGASKIMGVAPARGLIQRFLPLEDCKSLLNGVDVKSNSVVDFDEIRKNAENIPLNERENTLIADFSKIITIITENYGKVMGYAAFRGIVRAEFKVITASYGKVMEELGIKEKIHPELADLFE